MHYASRYFYSRIEKPVITMPETPGDAHARLRERRHVGRANHTASAVEPQQAKVEPTDVDRHAAIGWRIGPEMGDRERQK
jgi:hypothetical protein